VKLFKFLRRDPPANIPKLKSKGKAKPRQPARKEQQGFLARSWTWIRWVLGGIGTLLAGGAVALAYFAYYPRVFVDPPSGTTSPTHPFSAPFMLTNIGSIPIYSVEVDCGPPVGITFKPDTGPEEIAPDEKFDAGVNFKVSVFSAPKVTPLERHPFVCFGFVPVSFYSSKGRTFTVDNAWVLVKVHFKLFGFPKVFSNDFPFQGILGNDDVVHWSEEFLHESPPPKPIK
jgi:hypothetical protein